jgi:hypothetical protein
VFSWYDPDKKHPTESKFLDGIQRYQEKFGITPKYCLTSPLDALELADTKVPVEIQARSYIHRWLYYMTEELPA